MVKLPQELMRIIAYNIKYTDLINLCHTSKLVKLICDTPGFLQTKISYDIEKQYQKCITYSDLIQAPIMIQFIVDMNYSLNFPIGLYISDILLKLSDEKTTGEFFADSLKSMARIFSSIGRPDNTPSPTKVDWKIAYRNKSYEEDDISISDMFDSSIFDSLIMMINAKRLKLPS